MADSDTSKKKSRADHEAEIRAMRAGQDPNAKPPKKGKKKLVLLLSVLLLAAGGGAAYKFILAPQDQELVEVPEPEPEPEEPADLMYIDLAPMFVPFSTAEGTHHKIVVVLSLEVDRADHSDKHVRALMPRLREAYVRALTSRPFPGTEDGSIETVYLKNRIRDQNNRILGIGRVNDVLVRDIRVVAG